MMISPDTFYDEELKNKNAEEIMTVIRSLKKRIAKLKRTLEDPSYISTMDPNLYQNGALFMR